MQGLGLLRASEEGEEATVTSLLHSGVDPNFTHTVRERERFRAVVTNIVNSVASSACIDGLSCIQFYMC